MTRNDVRNMRAWRDELIRANMLAYSLDEKDFYNAWIRSIDALGGEELCFINFATGAIYGPPAISFKDWQRVIRMCNRG